MSSINNLPSELIYNIFSNNNDSDLNTLSKVSKDWRQMVIKINDLRIEMWKQDNPSIEIFDGASWNKCFGQNLCSYAPLPENNEIEALIFCPKNLTLNQLDQAAQKPKEGNALHLLDERYQFTHKMAESRCESHWLIVKKHDLPISNIFSLMVYAVTQYVQKGTFTIEADVLEELIQNKTYFEISPYSMKA